MPRTVQNTSEVIDEYFNSCHESDRRITTRHITQIRKRLNVATFAVCDRYELRPCNENNIHTDLESAYAQYNLVALLRQTLFNGKSNRLHDTYSLPLT